MSIAPEATVVRFVPEQFMRTGGVPVTLDFEDGCTIIAEIAPESIDGLHQWAILSEAAMTVWPNYVDAMEFIFGIGPWAE